MMQSYSKHNIQELPMSSSFFRKKVEGFLGENGLRLEDVDVYCVIENEAGDILAGAGLSSDIIKCIAVAPEARCEGLVAPLVSHLISLAAAKGILELKLFTKPENQAVFESLGFRVLASAPKAILMENGHGLDRYVQYLQSFAREGRNGVVVMNANPFTQGHLYLLQQASRQVDHLFVIPVKEDRSQFPYSERLEMIRNGVIPGSDRVSTAQPSEGNYFSGRDPKNQFPSAFTNPARNITVLEGSEYQISEATFPTYFLKDLSDASETQMRLDIDLFARHIAPALNATVRFVGSEPTDKLTARYNEIMRGLLPEVVVIPRLETISASSVRKALEEGSFRRASALCPETTWPYLLAALADRALRLELDTPGKPGLVGPDGPGAHKDMDYGTMMAGIKALRPFWPRMVLASSAEELRTLGIEAEKAMMAATGGVNTHRGAIFCLGVTLNAWAQRAGNEKDLQILVGETARGIYAINQKINNLPPRAAMQNALDGYKELFEDWLPFYASGAGELKTLLRIMSTLDDTCVIKRAGAERALQVKQEAKEMADQVGHDEPVGHLCERYAAEGISPGGAADMLALTIFIHSIII